MVALGEMVGERRLFTYRDLGFHESRPDLRMVGSRDPRTVLVVEKQALEPCARALHESRGVSYIILGGGPTCIDTEFFVEAMRAAGVSGPLRIIAYVDYDPYGWNAATGFAGQLERYGAEVSGIAYLITPRRFTVEELRLHAVPVETDSEEELGQVRRWIEVCGGINGQPLGIHSDRLPLDRVLAAFDEERARLA